MDFTQKCHFVVGSHTTEAPASITYSSLVSHKSVCLAFLIAALNNVNILSCDLEIAYLNAKCCEKIWFKAGIECGEDAGKVCVVMHALYGLKSAGASWRAELASVLQDLRYKSMKADPDIWIQAAVKDNGHEYYEMLFVYVDAILSVSHQACKAINKSVFNNDANWSGFYGKVEEELPANMPQPHGNLVTIPAFVDANHAGNVIMCHLHTGILIFVQNTLIIWFSKRQNMVESLMFGSKLVAYRICKELIVGLQYKLQMFGVPIDGPMNVFCDNCSVFKNLSILDLMLMKKHNAINYHAMRSGCSWYYASWKGRHND